MLELSDLHSIPPLDAWPRLVLRGWLKDAMPKSERMRAGCKTMLPMTVVTMFMMTSRMVTVVVTMMAMIATMMVMMAMLMAIMVRMILVMMRC